jgi:hypothetical protein
MGEIEIGRFRPFRYLFHYIVFLSPFLLLPVYLLFPDDHKYLLSFPIFFSLFSFVIFIPVFYVLGQYLFRKQIIRATASRRERRITLHYRNEVVELDHEYVAEIGFLFVEHYKLGYRLGYLFIRCEDNRIFYLTTLSFSRLQLETIPQILNIEPRNVKVFLPIIYSSLDYPVEDANFLPDMIDQYPEGKIAKDEPSEQSIKYLDKYYSELKEKDDSYLQNIIVTRERWQKEYIEAAEKLMEERKYR